MKKIYVGDAIGMALCHDITEINDGFKGIAFKRGHIIRPEDVEHMLNIGKRTVFIQEDHAGEIHEDDCARRMAAMAWNFSKGSHFPKSITVDWSW